MQLIVNSLLPLQVVTFLALYTVVMSLSMGWKVPVNVIFVARFLSNQRYFQQNKSSHIKNCLA